MMRPSIIKTLRSASLLALVLLALPCHASPPTKFVFRFDTRPPEAIAAQGFRALGHNYNFVDHVRGTSTYAHNADSAFISTSVDHDVALDFAREALSNMDDGRAVYLYTIRATDNFYNTRQTIEHIFHVHQTEPPIWMEEAVEAEEEYCAVDSIPPDQILTVERIRIINGEFVIDGFTNARYHEADTHVNEGPYTQAEFLPIEEGPVLLATPSLQTVDHLPPDLMDVDLHPLFPVFTRDDLFFKQYYPF